MVPKSGQKIQNLLFKQISSSCSDLQGCDQKWSFDTFWSLSDPDMGTPENAVFLAEMGGMSPKWHENGRFSAIFFFRAILATFFVQKMAKCHSI